MKITESQTTKYTLELSEAEFDTIVGCLWTAECGGTDKGDGVPYYRGMGDIASGYSDGGHVMSTIPGDLLAASLNRLGAHS